MSMDVRVAGESLGQFASNKGYSDLIRAADKTRGMDHVRAFFDAGETANVADVVKELLALALKVPADVATTARTLARLIARQKSVHITNGLI